MPPKKLPELSSTVTRPCVVCAKLFSSAGALADHCRSSGHSIPCTFAGCGKTFTSRQARDQHISSAAHRDARPIPIRNSTQKLNTTIPVRNDKPRHPGTFNPDAIEFMAPVVVGNNSKDARRGLLEPTRASTIHPVPPAREIPLESNARKQSAQSRLNTGSRVDAPSVALCPGEFTRNVSLSGSYALYDIKNCYLIGTPRNGGQSLVSPLTVDHNQDLEFTLLLPFQQQAQSPAHTGSCKSCGFVFTSWESVAPHFRSSTCSVWPTRPSLEEPINLSQPPHKQAVSHGRALINKNLSGLPGSLESSAKALVTQPIQRWSVIPELERAVTFATLTACCHSHTTLASNRYTSGPGYPKILGKEVPLSLIPLPSPAHDPAVLKRGAVAIDCEMVGVCNNESEVARLSAIDCLTNEVLIDTLVQPTQRVLNWRTKVSGITKKAMTAAVSEKRALKGWPEARAELWKHIDTTTILIGQALYHDLDALRMQHWKVVDSAILAKDAVGPGVTRQWGLKTLCDQLLGIEIQNDTVRGHDSVEDAFAAREVVLWCIRHPHELQTWGTKQREEYFRKKQAEADKRKNKRKAKPSSSLKLRYSTDDDDDDDDDEILRWEDIAEDCGYPHPDTGYDPWSD